MPEGFWFMDGKAPGGLRLSGPSLSPTDNVECELYTQLEARQRKPKCRWDWNVNGFAGECREAHSCGLRSVLLHLMEHCTMHLHPKGRNKELR